MFSNQTTIKTNPYRLENKKKKQYQRIALVVFFLANLGSLLLWIFHETFQMNQIHITGLERIPRQEFFQAIDGILASKRWYIFSGRSYLFVEEVDVAKILSNRFPLQYVRVEKIFPNTLSIKVQEKISIIIYDNGKEYSYVGIDGQVVEIVRTVGQDEWLEISRVNSSTERVHQPKIASLVTELGDYPIVYDTRISTTTINEPVLEEKFVQSIIEWFNVSKTLEAISFSYIIIQDDFGNATLKTKEGSEVRFRLDESSERQFKQLVVFLQQKAIDKNNFNYIDVRYPDRVYWQ